MVSARWSVELVSVAESIANMPLSHSASVSHLYHVPAKHQHSDPLMMQMFKSFDLINHLSMSNTVCMVLYHNIHVSRCSRSADFCWLITNYFNTQIELLDFENIFICRMHNNFETTHNTQKSTNSVVHWTCEQNQTLTWNWVGLNYYSHFLIHIFKLS